MSAIQQAILAAYGASAFDPAVLWPLGASSPGLWIDPAYVAASFQDSAGTTALSAIGTVADSANPVGLILDRKAGATVLADPGLHMSAANSPSSPLASAKGGQAVAGDGTYDAAGYPVYQQYDGTDDGMATAAFTAGTLTSAMDCLIAVRRDMAGDVILGLVNLNTADYFGRIINWLNGSTAVGCGSPTVLVDSVPIADTSVVLDAALTVGEWHVLEYRGLDLSVFTGILYGGTEFGLGLNGGRGPIMLFESGQDANRDLARAQMAAYFGVTMP